MNLRPGESELPPLNQSCALSAEKDFTQNIVDGAERDWSENELTTKWYSFDDLLLDD